MEYAVLGWPDEDPKLRLDYREFSYAGKFVMSNTGKAVVRDHERGVSDEDGALGADGTDRHGADTPEERDWIRDSRIVAAVAFNEDRTDSATAWLRYVTVRDDRRGAGLGARLTRFATARLRERGYERVKIAVNNPFAYHALYKAGFGYTAEETGIAELVLARPGDRSPDRYREGLAAYREREGLSQAEREFLSAKAGADPPDVVPVPE
ncbi:GNAT family N-acetyltransferase [Halorussus lipolyticus]|uniref:GNAT family N-acetyltransferase n=1 Tax=Halorussus lipolyticus TaxID=3034024 RepID=UPI0023E86D45|nr:GNAT family N-acetyltransferase [Halorussus sp. DT80]